MRRHASWCVVVRLPDLLRLLRRAKAVGQGRRTDREAEELPSESKGSRWGGASDYLADRLARTDPEQFPHRYERIGTTYDPQVAERMARMRQRVARLAPGSAGGHGGKREQRGNTPLLSASGNTSASVSRRLNRDRPDLAEKVARREISANAAAPTWNL